MLTPWLLALGAGLSTVLGSLIALAIKKPGPGFMSFTLGFSAGVMIFVSFVELLAKSFAIQGVGFFGANVAFFAGMASYFTIDLLVPHEYIGQHDHAQHLAAPVPGRKNRLERTGLLVALGISIHNFPEGMATFVGALEDIHLGLAIAVAIAIHNIPEGVAVSAPIYAATGSRRRAFLWSFLSGISEVVGASLAALILFPFLSERLMGFVLAAVAGIMVVISLDEIIPAAKSFESEHIPLLGILSGMMVMMLSLWMLR
jgi:ZIP family zinc transporter